MSPSSNRFSRALAVWPAGLAGEMNVCVSFHAAASASAAGGLRLRLAAASAYRVWANGVFLAQGPARTAHGFARVDEWALPAIAGEWVELVVEVVDYGVPSFCEAMGDAFLCAEILRGEEALAWTATEGGGFSVERRGERVQRIERYSYQRAFCEGYRFGAEGLAWLRPGYEPRRTLDLAEIVVPRRWLSRGTTYPRMDRIVPVPSVALGRGALGTEKIAVSEPYRFLHRVPEVTKGFTLSQVEWPLYETVARLVCETTGADVPAEGATTLAAGEWARWDFGSVQTGMPAFRIVAKRSTRVIALFDELLVEGGIRFDRLDALNAFWLELAEGAEIDFQLFEPSSLRYLQLFVQEGAAEISEVRLRNFVSGAALRGDAAEGDGPLATIRGAALASYRQNVLDLCMDCPSRERAGWLCDSFYMARAEWHLTGDNAVERAFLENYLLPEGFADLPAGMVPMCYPAEVMNGEFIPNWALFFLLQLDEAKRLRNLPDEWRPLVERRVRGLLDYFGWFENERGLLEKLKGWMFVEWSKANEFTQDVNFPTNMLYAAALEASARLLDDTALRAKAARVREAVRELAWRDGRFVDNALRLPSGELQPTAHASEVCQYCAFYFGLVTRDEKPELWRRLLAEDYGELYPANALHGKLYRLELLIAQGERAAAERDLLRLYAPMARETGTLWEHLDARASCNHGFTSYLAVLIDRMGSEA